MATAMAMAMAMALAIAMAIAAIAAAGWGEEGEVQQRMARMAHDESIQRGNVHEFVGGKYSPGEKIKQGAVSPVVNQHYTSKQKLRSYK
jgi:hypothetical protein